MKNVFMHFGHCRVFVNIKEANANDKPAQRGYNDGEMDHTNMYDSMGSRFNIA